MDRKKAKIVIAIMLIFTLLYGCGKKNSDDVVKENEKKFGEDIPYTDMSEYKRIEGSLGENNVYDYTNVFDTVYDWGGEFKLPFPKPKNKEAKITSNGTFTLDCMTKEELSEYFKELEKYGFKATFCEYLGKEVGLIYNEKLSAIFRNKTFTKRVQTQEGGYNDELTYEERTYEERTEVWVFTGFVNTPLIEAEKVHEMIDESSLLEQDERFKDYFIIPIENETVRKAGYYECLVFAEKYRGVMPGEARPYYMVSDGENICLFEEYGYSPYWPSSANYMEKDGKKMLVTTSGYYYFTFKSGSEEGNNTCMFTYELKDNKFVRTEKTRIDGKYISSLFIGKLVDGEIKLYHVEDYADRYNDDNYDYNQGMKDMWLIDEEFDMEKAELIQE